MTFFRAAVFLVFIGILLNYTPLVRIKWFDTDIPTWLAVIGVFVAGLSVLIALWKYMP